MSALCQKRTGADGRGLGDNRLDLLLEPGEVALPVGVVRRVGDERLHDPQPAVERGQRLLAAILPGGDHADPPQRAREIVPAAGTVRVPGQFLAHGQGRLVGLARVGQRALAPMPTVSTFVGTASK
jgi:hypothetical protein